MIKQRAVCDCSIACLAMLLCDHYHLPYSDEAYEEVWSFIHSPIVHQYDLDQYDKGVGLSGYFDSLLTSVYDVPLVPVRIAYMEYPALFDVPSRKNEGGRHAVYYDGQKFLDPSPTHAYDSDELMRTVMDPDSDFNYYCFQKSSDIREVASRLGVRAMSRSVFSHLKG